MKSYGVTIQMKATEQYFPVILFIMLYKVVLTFESVDEILWWDHSNERYWAVLFCGTVYYAVQGGSNFWSTYLIVRVASSLSQWMSFLSAFIKMIATEQCFNLQRLLFWKFSP